MIIISLCVCAVLYTYVDAAPLQNAGTFILIPVTSYQYPQYMYGQARRPFFFVGHWIESSDWFPVQINIPDILQSLSTNLGNAWNDATLWLQNAVGRIPSLGVLIRPNGQKYYIVLSTDKNNKTVVAVPAPVNNVEGELLDSYP